MSDVMRLSLPPAGLLPARLAEPQPARDVEKAAAEFEALLMGHLIRAAREAGAQTGWLSTEQESGQNFLDYAEQHVAQVLAASGGLGLQGLIRQGLQAQADKPSRDPPQVNAAAGSAAGSGPVP